MPEYIVDCRSQHDIIPLERWLVSTSDLSPSMFLSTLYNQLNFQTLNASPNNITLLWNYTNVENINSNLVWLWGWEFESSLLIKDSSDISTNNMNDHCFLCFGIAQMDTPKSSPVTNVTSTSFLYLVGLSLQIGKPIKMIQGYKYTKNFNGSFQSFVNNITKVSDLTKYEIRTDPYIIQQNEPFTKRIKILMGLLNGDGTTSIKIMYDDVLYVYNNIPCFSSTLLYPKTNPFIMLLGGGNNKSNYISCMRLSDLSLTGYSCTYEPVSTTLPSDSRATFNVTLLSNNITSNRNTKVTLEGVIYPINSYTGTLKLSLLNAPSGITLIAENIEIIDSNKPKSFTFDINISNIIAINRYTLVLQVYDSMIEKTVLFTLTITAMGIQITDANYVSVNTTNPLKVYSHTLTTLSNNKVLMIGGNNESTTILNSCVIGNINEGSTGMNVTWAQTTPYSLPISSHTTTKLFNENVLVIGGVTGNNNRIVNDCYIGNINSTNNSITWTKTTDYPLPVTKHSTVLLSDGRVLVIGGMLGNVISRNCYFGVINSNNSITWTKTTDYPFAVNKHIAILLENNKVLVIGGNDGLNTRKDCYVGEINNNNITWIKTTDYPLSIRDHVGMYINNNQVLVIGGFDNKEFSKKSYIGRIETGINISWIPTTDYPILISATAISPLINNQFLIVGGWNGQAISNIYKIVV